jgi:SPP1 family predicted phage head-tail adaptor
MGARPYPVDTLAFDLMDIRASDLDQRIVVRREVITPDGSGGFNSEWQDVVTCWAAPRPMSGREREQAQRLNAQSNYIFTVRDSVIRVNSIDERDVIYWHGVTFNIRHIPDKARARFVEIEAERGTAV